MIDSCDVRAKLPEQVSAGASSQGGIEYNPMNPYCHVAPGVTTRATAAGTYTVPRFDVQVSATLTSSPGVPLEANWVVSNAVARESLGRDLGAGATSNVTVNLLAPGQMRTDRVNELDFRDRQDSAVRVEAGEHRTRPVQRVEPRHGSDLQRYVRSGGPVAGADLGADGANRKDHRAIRFLSASAKTHGQAIGGGWGLGLDHVPGPQVLATVHKPPACCLQPPVSWCRPSGLP